MRGCETRMLVRNQLSFHLRVARNVFATRLRAFAEECASQLLIVQATMPSCKPLLSGDRPVLYQLLPFGAMAPKHRDRSRSPPQQHADTLGITATSLSGETMALEFDSAATVRDLRRILARRLGAPEHGVSILVGNEKLCDMTKLLRDACGDGHVTVLKCSRPWLLAPTGLGTGRYSLDSQNV